MSEAITDTDKKADPYNECGLKTGKVSIKSFSGKYNDTWTSAINAGFGME